MSSDEQMGRLSRDPHMMLYFCDASNRVGRRDLGFLGNKFTWARGCSGACEWSDHAPLLLNDSVDMHLPVKKTAKP
ncbi:conserved hypothetical protein [Ricinus communis]|uniref:Endonuclease/exonuclease/phosphatase domain-containing protein n=1 Tax=Ricinus communis TaxID=3988 RepID=B9S6K3_RICCO|nr:conserved hypothetical protein [Ricinus communis]